MSSSYKKLERLLIFGDNRKSEEKSVFENLWKSPVLSKGVAFS